MKYLLLILSVLCLTVSAQSSSNLLAHYKFCNNANDVTGQHNGSIVQAVTTSDRKSASDAALSFDGADDYVEVPHSTVLSLNNTDFTISGWIYPESHNTAYGRHRGIVFKRESGVGGYVLGIHGTFNSTNARRLIYQINGGFGETALSNSEIALNTWTHVAVTYSATDQKITFFINGVNDGSTLNIPSPVNNTGKLIIGGDELTGEHEFDGALDDIKLYSKALNASDITALFNEYPGCCELAEYKFEGNASDLSGNLHNGTITNASLTSDRNGNASSAFSFNGSNSYIEVPHAPELSLNNKDFTINGWINLAEYNQTHGNQSGIVFKRTSAGGFVFGVHGTYTSANSGRLFYQINGGFGESCVGNTVVPLNEWVYVAAVYSNSTNTMTLYLNGQADGSVTISTPPANTGNLRIGNDEYINGHYFNGKIDDIEILNCALSPNEIAERYKEESSSNLIAHYKFCNNANDVTGKHDGSIVQATAATDRKSSSNAALSFDGADDYVEVPHSTVLSLNNTDFTISGWIYPESHNTAYGRHRGIVFKRESGVGGYVLGIHGTFNSTNARRLIYQINGGFGETALSNSEIALNTWTHVAVTYSATDQKITFFINGVNDGSTLNIPSPVNNTGKLIIGGDELTGEHEFDGAMDDIKLYSKILSGSEITSLYKEYSGCCELAKYKFEGNAFDLSGNLHNGILTDVTSTSDRNSTPLSAYSFNGSSSYIEVPHTAELSLNNQDFTIDGWISLAEYNQTHGNQSGIVFKRTSAGGFVFGVHGTYTPANSGRLFYQINGGFGESCVGNTVVPLNEWVYVAAVYSNSTNTMTLYLNGQADGSVTIPTPPANTGNLRIGNDEYINGHYFNGKIDDIEILNCALSPNEIAERYNGGIITSTSDAKQVHKLSVFPNPTSNELTISSDVAFSTVILTDVTGRTVYTGKESELSLSKLKAGIYRIRILNAEGEELYSESIIKN